ncbi:MAG TPA: hypothetical protein VE404_04980 [Verrucomicrobiae bacterium]|nr:hypothetical protein [Verrucomicrobiae bacterium]
MPHPTEPTPRRVRPVRRGEFGASGLKLFISLIFLALLAHTAYMFIPVYIAVYDFDSQVEREANYGATKSNEAIVKALVDYAAERHLPLKKENLKIVRGQSRITIDGAYSVPVKTLFYTYDWKIDIKKEAVLF